MTKVQGYLDGPLKPIINLLIPVSTLLAFMLVGLFSLMIQLNFYTEQSSLLSPTAFFMIDSGFLDIVALTGVISSLVIFLGWMVLIVKNKGQYLLTLNRAIFIVIFVWLIGTLCIPFLLYLLYKPIL